MRAGAAASLRAQALCIDLQVGILDWLLHGICRNSIQQRFKHVDVLNVV